MYYSTLRNVLDSIFSTSFRPHYNTLLNTLFYFTLCCSTLSCRTYTILSHRTLLFSSLSSSSLVFVSRLAVWAIVVHPLHSSFSAAILVTKYRSTVCAVHRLTEKTLVAGYCLEYDIKIIPDYFQGTMCASGQMKSFKFPWCYHCFKQSSFSDALGAIIASSNVYFKDIKLSTPSMTPSWHLNCCLRVLQFLFGQHSSFYHIFCFCVQLQVHLCRWWTSDCKHPFH